MNDIQIVLKLKEFRRTECPTCTSTMKRAACILWNDQDYITLVQKVRARTGTNIRSKYRRIVEEGHCENKSYANPIKKGEV